MRTEVSDAEGWPQLTCWLDLQHLDNAAAILAESIVRRRIGVNAQLHSRWLSRLRSPNRDPVDERDLRLFEAGLLQNLGTPDQPRPSEQLHGLVAESIWFEVVSDVDAGLGVPIRVERHDWSVTDPGGDGLTVYATKDASFCFRLWELKYHGTGRPVKHTVNAACRQVEKRSLSYLARFSLIAQDIADNDDLARFYGELAERWVDGDPAAGVGIGIGADSDAEASDCFDKVTTYFKLDISQHQAQLHITDDFAELADRVRSRIWKGCGLWTER